MTRGRLLLSVGAGVFLALVLGMWLATRHEPSAPSAPVTTSDEPGALPSSSTARSAQRDRVAAPVPQSLNGTDADGALSVTASGHLLPDVGLRRFFDYYLSASGEEPDAQLHARVRTALTSKLHEPALGEALHLFDAYLAYQQAARVMEPKGDGSPRARFEQLLALRRQYLGAAAAVSMFADEESLEVKLARVTILENKVLTPEERQAQLAALEAKLPASEQAARKASAAPLQQMQAEQALRARGGTDADVEKLREQNLPADAVSRLQALDQSHAEWQQRLAAYQARDATENGSLSPADHAQHRAALRSQLFTPQEQLRVQALEEAGMLR